MANAPAVERPIDLNDGAGVWLVEQGHVDCFAIEPDASASGRRKPLFSVPQGAVLIGVDPCGSPVRLTAIPSLGGVWRRLGALPEPHQLAGWTQRVLRAAVLPAPDLPDRQDEEQLTLAPEERLAFGRKLVVLDVTSGIVRLGGRVAWTPADGPLLASEPLWAEAESAASATFAPSTERLAEALQGLGRFLLGAVEHRLIEDHAAENKRLEHRRARETDAMAHGLHGLAGAAERKVRIAGSLSPDDPISAAIAPVLAALGEAPLKRAARQSVEDTLTAHGIRFRRILFRLGWKEHSSEPIIGFLGEARHPVALLPGRRWRVQDLAGERPLDSATEEELQFEGLQIYRSLPEHAANVRTLLLLGTRNGGRDVIRVLILGLLGAGTGLAVPMAMGQIFDTLIPNADVAGLVAMMLVLGVLAVAAGGFAIANALALVRVEARFEINSSPALMDRLLKLPMTFFRQRNVGDVVDRLLGIQQARALLGASLSQLIFGSIFALSSLLLLVSFGFMIGLVALLLGGTLAGINVAISRAQLKLTRDETIGSGKLNGFVLQLITGIAKLRGAAAEKRALAQWATRFAPVVARNAAVRRWAALQRVVDDSVPLIAVALMYLTIRTAGASLSSGDVIAVAAAFAQLLAALLVVARALNQAAQATPLVERAQALLATAPEKKPEAETIGRLEGQIAMRNVSFRYAANGPLILDDLSFDIAPGAFVAFVGPSGSGKSTVLRLLLGFERADAGEVMFDGRIADRLDPQSLRRQIGVVLQNGQVFAGSILENILGPASLGIADAWAAARMVGLAEDIEAMPMGMHTVLLDGGGTISGGQRQRIVIARALVHRPRILLFDEATSALDNRTQAIVTETLSKLSITRVVIAHRLTTIEGVDEVFVVDRGRLVQRGGYQQLLDQPGPFAELARRQITE